MTSKIEKLIDEYRGSIIETNKQLVAQLVGRYGEKLVIEALGLSEQSYYILKVSKTQNFSSAKIAQAQYVLQKLEG